MTEIKQQWLQQILLQQRTNKKEQIMSNRTALTPAQMRPKVFDYNEYEKTGNPAIDLVAACVGHYRRFMRPLKTIYLQPWYMNKFKDYLKLTMGEQYNDEQTYQFDGVDIVQASKFQRDSLTVDFYNVQNAKA